MNDVATESQSNSEGRFFRPFIGVLCVVGSLLGFGALYVIPIPEKNEQALLLALGVIFGWGSAVVQSEYGATATGRKVAESAIRKIERQDIADGPPVSNGDGGLNDPARPAGTSGDPVHTTEEKKP